MAQASGIVEGTFRKLFTKSCTVAAVEAIGPYRLIKLRDRSLAGVVWEPGQKVEVFLGSWVKRTYTPMSWKDDEVELLAYIHGDGPGASWARDVAVGATCALLGPRRSLDLEALERPALLFGDETSIGLTYALRSTTSGRNVVHVALEVTSAEATRPVLGRLELDGVHVVQRAPGDAHLRELDAWMDSLPTLRGCVLSGKASSIQALNKRVRARGLTSKQIATRAYWATGKRGLD